MEFSHFLPQNRFREVVIYGPLISRFLCLVKSATAHIRYNNIDKNVTKL